MLDITVKINDKKYSYPKGISLLDISKDFQSKFNHKIIIAKVNESISELSKKIYDNCSIGFYDRSMYEGLKAYESGLLFIMIKAFKDEFNIDVIIKHSLDKGILVKTNHSINNEVLTKVKKRMDEIIKKDIPIDKLLINRKEAIKYYEKNKEYDKVKMLKYNTNTNVNLYKLDNMYDYFFSFLPVSTGYMEEYKLNLIDDNNFVISYPSLYSDKISYKHHDKLFNEFEEYSEWCKKIGISTIPDLNERVSNGTINDYIFLSETHQNNNLYEIARKIFNNKNIRIVLISGPSSSGKTTTSRKLQLFLKGFGVNPKTLSIDDYFVDREKTPRKEDGTLDYECIESIRIDAFNKDLAKLLKGEKVKTPTFNFIEGKGEYITEPMELKKDEILIIEGLHALNEKISSLVDKKNKYKIYLSPLTVLNIDNHNRIKTTDIRLLRRIVRDSRTRGYTATEVIGIWNMVRRGEEEYVFPFQDEADVVFNTTLIYELGVLKTYVEPLLYLVDEEDVNYKYAVRLLKILKEVLPIPSDYIPKDSILREFIGEGYFL